MSEHDPTHYPELHAKIEADREALARTADALAAKMDVKAQAHDLVEEKKDAIVHAVHDKKEELRENVAGTLASVQSHLGQVKKNLTGTAHEANSALTSVPGKSRHVWETAPDRTLVKAGVLLGAFVLAGVVLRVRKLTRY